MEVIYINLVIFAIILIVLLLPKSNKNPVIGIAFHFLIGKIQKIGIGFNLIIALVFWVLSKYNWLIYSLLCGLFWFIFPFIIIYLFLSFDWLFVPKKFVDYGYVSRFTHKILQFINFLTFDFLRKYLKKRNQKIRDKYIKPIK